MQSEVPEKRPGSDSGQVLQLLEEGAPLFRYPGPILLLNREKKIVGANPAARSLVHGIMSGSALSVIALVTEALSGGNQPQSKKIMEEESGRTTEITALPVDSGEYVFLLGRDISSIKICATHSSNPGSATKTLLRYPVILPGKPT